MQLYAIEIKGAIAAVFTFLTTIWGAFGWLALTWVACMALDYISGSIAAKKEGAWSSAKAREGLAHKGGMILFVLGGAILDSILGLGIGTLPLPQLPFEYTAPVTALVLCWYILTELGSLFENAQKLGAAFPPGLQSIIDALKKHIFPNDNNGSS